MAVAADPELVGRDDELASLREFVGAVPEGPRALVLRGDPGIGKTAVWRAGLELSEETCTLLSARCVEAELPLALVGLSDLVGEAFGDIAGELDDHERAALAAALGLAAADGPTRDALALSRAFLALVRLLARDEPVLIAVDDVQWLDPSSARILSFSARRLGDLPVGILVTQRGDGPDPLDLGNAVGAAYEELQLGPLSLGAIVRLVRSRSDVRLPRPVLARVHEASGGNPMFALEFARSLARDRPQLGPIAVPSSLLELVRARVERCPADVRRVLAMVAAAERPTPAMLSAVDPAASELLDAAVDLGAVVVGDGLVRFSHPLLGSAAYGDLTPTARRSLHRELAQVCDDVEERARHLALAAAGPEPSAAALLDEAAARAFGRGAPEAAAELAQEALRLTPPGEDSLRFERTLGAAWQLAGASRFVEARELLDRLLAGGLEGPRRVRAVLMLTMLADDVDEGLRLTDALAHVGTDLALRVRVLLALSSYQFYREDLDASEAAARQALAAAEEAGEGPLMAAAVLVVADRADLGGRPEPDLVERAVQLADNVGVPSGWPSAREMTSRRLLRSGDLDGARCALEADLTIARERGALPDRYRLLRDLADVERHAGHWELSERYLDEIEENAEPGSWAEAEIMQRRAALAAVRGRAEEARELAGRGEACAEAINWPHLAAMNRWGIGSLELSLGDPVNAWDALGDIRRTETWGRLESLEAVADAIEALVGLGDLEDAQELLLTLQEDRNRGHLWAGPGTLRCEALLWLAQGSLEAAVAAAEEAAAGFERRGFPLHSGRALLVAGEAFRRAGERRRAGGRLDEARAIFLELGAACWVARCDNELRRARPRPRRDRELTHAERRVAALVALGKKNREVAAQLFTTVATVEAHLTRIYRKLGIRSRTELARLVADRRLSLDED